MRDGVHTGARWHQAAWLSHRAAWLSVAALVTATLTGSGGAAAQSPNPTVEPGTAAQVEQLIEQAFAGSDVEGSLQAYWASTFPTFSDEPYHDPAGGFFPYHSDEASGGACGEAPGAAAQNAAYCFGDESITYDVDWLASLYQREGAAGPLTVLAHEWGHHIQHLAGEPDISKSAELQADCYAGMYLGGLTDMGILGPTDISDSLAVTYSLGDAPASPDEHSAWTDPDVHGAANERRQAEGIGYATEAGSYCVAYGDWADEPPAPLFDDKTIRLEPFADPTRTEDDAFQFSLPDANVELTQGTYPEGTIAADELAAAIVADLPDAAGWDIAAPEDGWLETLGWGTGSGATTTFSGTAADGTMEAGVAALQVDPTGEAQLYISMGTDTTDPEIAIGQGQDALNALAWGYCDPEAAVTTNCPAGAASPSPAE